MNVVLPIPDEFAARFGTASELGRRALEALAAEEYRAGRLTREELRQLLGFETMLRLDGFLRAHGIIEAMTIEEFERDLQDIERSGL